MFQAKRTECAENSCRVEGSEFKDLEEFTRLELSCLGEGGRSQARSSSEVYPESGGEPLKSLTEGLCNSELLLQKGYPAVRREEGVQLGGILSRWGHRGQKEQSPTGGLPSWVWAGQSGGRNERGRQMGYKERDTLTFWLQDAEKASFRWDTTGGQPHK